MSAIGDLLGQVVEQARTQTAIPLIGLAGAQGSGKSYHARALVHTNPQIAHFSLDDVYLARAERRHLADTVHPLFITRGPPGTHDLDLALRTIERLRRADDGDGDATAMPRFDKARDDRMPEALWPRFTGRPEAILIDGWCLGATWFSPDKEPINALEAEADRNGRWRTAMADALSRYQPFFASFDEIVYLRPPNFEVVNRWRGEQEEKMLGRPLTAEETSLLKRFIQHYERITLAMMDGEHSAKWVVHLDEARHVISFEQEKPGKAPA